VSVTDLADALGVSHADVIKELIRNGIFATINQSIDFDTAADEQGDMFRFEGVDNPERIVLSIDRVTQQAGAPSIPEPGEPAPQ